MCWSGPLPNRLRTNDEFIILEASTKRDKKRCEPERDSTWRHESMERSFQASSRLKVTSSNCWRKCAYTNRNISTHSLFWHGRLSATYEQQEKNACRRERNDFVGGEQGISMKISLYEID